MSQINKSNKPIGGPQRPTTPTPNKPAMGAPPRPIKPAPKKLPANSPTQIKANAAVQQHKQQKMAGYNNLKKGLGM
jgi:hypothetical protein